MEAIVYEEAPETGRPNHTERPKYLVDDSKDTLCGSCRERSNRVNR